MSKSNAWYYNLPYILRLVLAIIPVTAWFVHAIARITSGKLSGLVIGIICLFGVGLIVWVIDLVTTIVTKRLLFC